MIWWWSCNGNSQDSQFILALWDSRDKAQHMVLKDLPVKESNVVGKRNIMNELLVESNRIMYLPLHIKLELNKQLVKAV